MGAQEKISVMFWKFYSAPRNTEVIAANCRGQALFGGYLLGITLAEILCIIPMGTSVSAL